jgi:hypothetical protein
MSHHPSGLTLSLGLRREEWLTTLETKFNVLLKQQVFKDFSRQSIPCNAQLLTSGIVTKIKTNGSGNEVCLKACIVVHGNRQITGLSYGDTFSNMPDLQYIQIIFLIVAYANLDCHMVDVTRAYMHTLIDRPLYIEYPERYGKPVITAAPVITVAMIEKTQETLR